MKKIDRRALKNEDLLALFKEGIYENNEEKTVEMLETLLSQEKFSRKILDAFFVKIESRHIEIGSRMCNIIAHTILAETTYALSCRSALISDTLNLRKFSEIVLESETVKDAINWYEDYYSVPHHSGR